MTSATTSTASPGVVPFPGRIVSVDALRGAVMFTMIFVNDLAGAPEKIVPAWMRHFHGKSGMTFVDLVFPAFLFIVGMSIPFALEGRLAKGQPIWKILWHVVSRTFALLVIGVLMVNESPDTKIMGWSASLWSTAMYLSGIFAFCAISPRLGGIQGKTWNVISRGLRVVGWVGLVFLAFSFRGSDNHRIISLSPFSIHTEWYGILGLIGWAYLAASVVYLCFRGHRTALLGSAVLLLCFYPADKNGFFQNFWLAHYVGFGETLGSQAAISVAGILLGSILLASDTATVRSRTIFTLLFIAGFSAAALLLHGLYGINKNNATPSWCLWACSITAASWLILYYFCDVRPANFLARPLAMAGQNVLLAYLLSEMLPSALDLIRLGNWYWRLAEPSLASAIARSAGCAIVILVVSTGLNRFGFRLKI